MFHKNDKIEKSKRLVSDTEGKVLKMLNDTTLKLSNAQLKFELKVREGPHLQDKDQKIPDFEFPSKDKLEYENNIIGFMQNPGSWNGVNVIMSDGLGSDLPYKNSNEKTYSEVKINPPEAVVRKVIMWGNHEFSGVQFFDKNGTKIL
jgi:hypothetical protein